uniref:HTH_48 domain-containing protein n=1 Tax=Heterorhabditis bacteriophora TaxID=37862 RepID=A0A1I7XCR7_HETBA
MGHKIPETARNINQAFGEGTVNNRTTRYWFQNFRNGDESLEDEGSRRHPLVIQDNKLRAIVEANSRKTSREVAEELDVVYSTVSRHLPKCGNQKSLTKCSKNCDVYLQHWSIEKNQFLFMSMLDRMYCK